MERLAQTAAQMGLLIVQDERELSAPKGRRLQAVHIPVGTSVPDAARLLAEAYKKYFL
jgi:hypothetical protein